jgi:hypothetical protein
VGIYVGVLVVGFLVSEDVGTDVVGLDVMGFDDVGLDVVGRDVGLRELGLDVIGDSEGVYVGQSVSVFGEYVGYSVGNGDGFTVTLFDVTIRTRAYRKLGVSMLSTVTIIVLPETTPIHLIPLPNLANNNDVSYPPIMPSPPCRVTVT